MRTRKFKRDIKRMGAVAPVAGFVLAGLFTFVLSGCLIEDEKDDVPPPAIAYASPMTDTVGIAAAHAVLSTGGPVTLYSALSPLPLGLFVNGQTGAISGIPLEETEEEEYRILALGEGGADTAIVTIAVRDTAAEEPPAITGTIVLNIGLQAVNAQGNLAKTSVIVLRKLVVTLTSNGTGDSLISDTAFAGSDGFGATAAADQQVMVAFDLPALRSWTVAVKTLDANDSLVHAGTAAIANLLVGEVRPVTLSLTPRYTAYALKAALPDSIFSPAGVTGQKISFTRIEWLVDGKPVRDSSAAFAAFTVHTLAYDYIREGAADTLEFRVYGTLQGAPAPWNGPNNLLYARKVAFNALTAVHPAPNTVALTWRGPVAGVSDLTVDIGRIGYVTVEPPLPGEPLPKRAGR